MFLGGYMKNIENNILNSYTSYLCFNPDEAKAWVLDVIKYFVEYKHKNYIPYTEYSKIVQEFKKFLEDKRVKLLSCHELLDSEEVQLSDYIKEKWGIKAELVNEGEDTQLMIPDLLTKNILKQFNYDYFKIAVLKQSVSIILENFTLVKLLKYDISEIKAVYEGGYIYPLGMAPKFYLNTIVGDESLDYVHKFVTEKVLGNLENVLMWDVLDNQTNKCVAVIYLQIDNEAKVAYLDVVLDNDYSNVDLAEVIKLIKGICFKKFELTKVIANNDNIGWAYSTLNSIYHFAGFKAKYDFNHSDFEAVQEDIPALDELYNTHEDIINKIVIE